MRWQTKVMLFLVVNIFLFSCKEPNVVIERDIEVFEVADQIAIGSSMSQQIYGMPEEFNTLDSIEYKEAYIYVNRLLNTLKLTSVVKHREDFPWKVIILHDDQIKNAFTLPGGYIYIYTGLLKFLTAEHELIAVLSNEIAYADKQLSAISLREEHGGVVLGNITLGQVVPELPEIVANFPMTAFTEELVADADEYAIELICPFQYDANGLRRFIQKAHAAEIEWIQSKKIADMESRLSKIETYTAPCGVEGVTNLEQYQRKIKNFLP